MSLHETSRSRSHRLTSEGRLPFSQSCYICTVDSQKPTTIFIAVRTFFAHLDPAPNLLLGQQELLDFHRRPVPGHHHPF